MPLRFAPEPRNASTLIRAGLDRIGSRKSPLAPGLTDFAALQSRFPHAVYDLRADEISDGRGLEFAHVTSFRYLIDAPGGPIAAAEVQTDAFGNATLLANLNYGPFVNATARALELLEGLDEVRAGSFEVRLLRFSAIYLVAIWLKSQTDLPDIIYPLAPAPAGLQAERPYGVDEFMRAIMPLAQERAAATNPWATP